MKSEIKIGKNTYQKSNTWSDVSPEFIGRLLLLSRLPENMRKREIWEEIVRICLNMSLNQWNVLVLSIEQWKLLKTECNWVFTEKIPNRKPFASFFYNETQYYLPDANYDNTTAIEIAWANKYYLQFAHPTTPDTTALDKLIATLCRPQRANWNAWKKNPSFDGDRREPFNDYLTTQRASELADLPFETKCTILMYFQAMNNDFMSEFSELFGSGPAAPPRYGNGEGWLTMLKTIAQKGTFGNFSEVSKQPARLVWLFVLDDVLDQKDEQEAQEKANQELE